MALGVSTAVRFVPNLGIEDDWNESADGQECKRQVAEEILAEAQAIAPVRTGTYRDSLGVEESPDDVAVIADVDYGGYIEFGTSDTPEFAPLRRGRDEAGYGR